jgi:hypothetical protein
VRSEVISAVLETITVFCDVTLRRWIGIMSYQRLEQLAAFTFRVVSRDDVSLFLNYPE